MKNEDNKGEKVCTVCKKKKGINSFYKNSRMLEGRLNQCKACIIAGVKKNRRENNTHYNEYNMKRYRSNFQAMFSYKYTQMKVRVEGKGTHNYSSTGQEILSREEFMAWCNEPTNLKEFAALHNEWENNDFKKRASPSIDRIDNGRGYIVSNMQWLPFLENCRKR